MYINEIGLIEQKEQGSYHEQQQHKYSKEKYQKVEVQNEAVLFVCLWEHVALIKYDPGIPVGVRKQ